MVKITIEDIIFWLIIIFVITIAIWMLFGSPTLEGALISVGTAIITSELLLWKKFYLMDKRTTIGFLKIKNDMDKNNLMINNRFDNIENKLNMLIKRR